MDKVCACKGCQGKEISIEEVLGRANAVLFDMAEVVDILTLIGNPNLLYALQCNLDNLFIQSAALLERRINH